MNISLSAFAPENLVSRDGFGSPVPRQPTHLHTQAESGAYLRDSSRVPRRRPYAFGSVPCLSDHAIAYRWRSLPRVRQHRASKPRGSSKRVLPWQVTMDQLICASLSHTDFWYEVGILKGSADSIGAQNICFSFMCHWTMVGICVSLYVVVVVCVCVFFPSILDIKFVGRTSRGHTGGRSHRIFNPPSFCGACLDFCREKDSAIPFPRRP